MNRRLQYIAALVLSLMLPLCPVGELVAEAQPPPQFTSFSAFRAELLNRIGMAKNRIWLVTSYLTDGEVVAALYIAQYRRLDVKVLLGAEQANWYMSRLNYLKKQGIPVYLKSKGLKFAYPSGILIDDTLFALDADLNFMTAQSKFSIRALPDAESFKQGFETSLRDAIPATIKPALVRIGRRRDETRNTASAGNPSFREMPPPARNYGGETDGSYDYNRAGLARRGAPSGMPTQLPKMPVYARPKVKAEAVEKNSQERHNSKSTVTDSPNEGAADTGALDSLEPPTGPRGDLPESK